MCHSSCATCVASSELFTSCLTCKTPTKFLQNGVCYCYSLWGSDCISQSMFVQIFKFCHTFLILSFILLVILYCLKIKLPLSYRVLSGLQGISLLIYSSNIYFDNEDFYMLRTFNLLSGPYNLTYRLESLSNTHAIQTYILLCVFVFLLLVLYYPSNTFYKQFQSFWEYIQSSAFQYLQNFYYFGGKMMFFYIGAFISSKSLDIILIIHLIIFCLLILATFGRLIYQYHKNNLSEQIFQGPIYLYIMLANSGFIGIAMSITSEMLLLIYCIPLGLLIIISIVNKDIKILDANSIKFYIIEIIMIALSICVILLSDPMKTFVIFATVIISLIVFVYELSTTYYGGISLVQKDQLMKKTNKVQPMNQEQDEHNNSFENQNKKNTNHQINSKSGFKNSKRPKFF